MNKTKVEQLVYVAPLNKEFVIPNTKKCTWNRNIDPGLNPHPKQELVQKEKIAADVLSLIGSTPLVKLNRIPQKAGIKCNIYAKCEFLNPGGSLKDRVAYRFVKDAEDQGLLKPGYTIIEPSSGNTGIALALVAAVRGYRCIIVLSERMSEEKISVLHALGAETVRIPITDDLMSAKGLFGMAHKLKTEIPNSIIFNQFGHPGTALAHYDTTAEEILEQCDNKLDMFVMGGGTGGTITGIGRKLKEKSPNTIVVGVDPEGSVFAQPEALNKTDISYFEVEGMGYEFVPSALDRSVVDVWVKTNDKEIFPMARRIIKEEGILCGGSSGAILSAALKCAKNLREGQNVVVLIPDSIRNYLTKFVSDHWMEARNLQPCLNKKNLWWWENSVNSLKMKPVITVPSDKSCKDVVDLMKKEGVRQIPVVDENGEMVGVATLQHLVSGLVSEDVNPKDDVGKRVIRIYPKAYKSAHLGLISRILEKDSYAVILEKHITGSGVAPEKPVGVVEATDLLKYINKK